MPEALERRDLLTAQLQVIQTGVVQNSVVVGQLLDETYQISNVGNTSATGVTATDTLPAGVDLIAASTSSGTVSETAGVVTANLGTLAAGAVVTVDVQMTATGAATLTNQMAAKASNATTEQASSVTTASIASLGADLQVSGSSTPTTAVPGQDLRYSFTVTNNSNNSAPGALLTTQLPAGVVLLSAGVSGQTIADATDDNGVVTATLGNLGAGQSETVTIDVMPTVAGSPGTSQTSSSLTATAFATDINGDTNLANNQQTVNTTVNSASNSATLSVSTTAPNTLLVGQAGTYRITVTNQGGGAASNVVLWDQIPAGALFLDATTSQGTIQVHDGADHYVSANLGNLAQGQSATLTLIMTPITGAALVNEAEATTDSGLSSVTSAVSGETLTPSTSSGAVNLSVSTTPSASAVYLGQALAYTVTLTNQSSATARNTVLTDPLPGYLTFVSATSTSGTTPGGATLGTVTYVNGSVVDNIGNLNAGRSVTLTLLVTPNEAGELINTAIATSDNGVTNTNASVSQNVTADGNIPPASAADLVVTKTDSANGASVTVGQQITYTITVQNGSVANAASNVVLTDMLPAAESYVSSSSVLGTITEANGIVSDNIGSLNPGQSETVQITVTVTGTGTITNTAVATTDSGVVNAATIAGSDTLGQGTVTTGPADLSLSLSHSTDNVAIVPGQALTYTITVTNNSPSFAATGVQISDSLPGGVTFISAESGFGTVAGGTPDGTVSESGGTIIDNLGTLAAGQSVTLTLQVMPLATGGLVDSATVTSTSTDPNSANNSGTDNATVTAAPAATTLAITKTASPTTVLTGGTVTYTLTVTNTGSQTANNVVVTDQLPAGEQFASGSATTGTITSANGDVTADLGTLAAGASATITLTVTADQTGVIENTAVVTTDTGVVNPNNSLAHATITVSTAGNGGGGGGGGGNANVSITNTAAPTSPFVGQQVTFTIAVNNTGTGDADSVIVTDSLPAGMTLLSESASRGAITVSGNTVTVNIGLLTSEQGATITLTALTTTAETVGDTASYSTPSPNSSPATSATATVSVLGSGAPAYLTGQPGDGTDLTFVRNVYHELLDRDPDAGGQAYWLSFLEAPGANSVLQRNLFVQGILGSNEYETHFVQLVYEDFLHRLADSGGLQYFVGLLGAGVSEQQVISVVVSSPEYFASHGDTSKGFVDALYEDILGRAADPAGEAYWVSQLDSHALNTAQAIDAFLESSEGDALLINNPTDSALAALTVGGGNQLYFQGNLTTNAQDVFFNELEAQTPYQVVIRNMLETGQYYNANDKFLP
ncbi:MAG TPA: DUF4214 domain-containing protein [Pirellulales bacterium]|nr:DUF4214 domain-containing protein [Pirellulales bacterium]